MTAATDQEETALGTARNAPWLLETRLKESGADYTHAGLWEAYIVRDGNLISGQNPASTGPLADAVLQELDQSIV